MCKHGTEKFVTLNRPREVSERIEVPVDACIANEIQELNNNGVWTLGCCCGHFENAKSILIHESSKELVIQLGYTPVFYSENTYDIGG